MGYLQIYNVYVPKVQTLYVLKNRTNSYLVNYFNKQGQYDLLINSVKGKKIELKITGSMQKYDDFSMNVVSGEGDISVSSDLK